MLKQFDSLINDSYLTSVLNQRSNVWG